MLPLRDVDPYIRNILHNRQKKSEKLTGALVLAALCALEIGIPEAHRACNCEDYKSRSICASYVLLSWGFMGYYLGKKTAPYVFEGSRRIYEYVMSHFPDDIQQVE